MPSAFRSVMQQAGGALTEAFGESEPFTYTPPQGKSIGLVGWSLSTRTGQEIFNEQRREVSVMESIKITGPPDALTQRGINHYQRDATVTVYGQEFHIDPLQSVFGGTRITLGLKRKPLIEKNQLHASV